jgi:Tfp pilus assembly protein PilN
MPKAISFDINLAPKDPFFATPLGKILKWALSVGRYVVIFTEVIVIVSFVSRFTLDRQITDLNNSINQKVNVIDSFGELEDNIRTTQKMIDDYKQVEQSTKILKTFPALTEVTPQGVILRQLTIRPNQIAISGTTFSQENLNIFISNLTLSEYFTDIDVSRIESDPQQDSNFSFAISAQIAK